MIYYVYILANQWHTVFYFGVTNNIEERVFDHKVKRNRSFTAKYNCDKLFSDIPKLFKVKVERFERRMV